MNMREIINIFEGRDAPLFHGTNLPSACRIVLEDTLGLAGGAVSLSRSFQRAQDIAMAAQDDVVVLVLDQSRLNQRFRIEPHHDQQWQTSGFYGKGYHPMYDEQEERVKGVIRPVSRYLVSINVDVELIDRRINGKLDYEYRDAFGGDQAARDALIKLLEHPMLNRWSPRT